MSAAIARVELQFLRSTASFHRYETDDESAPVRNLYVAKSALPPGTAPPKSIIVTVTPDVPPA